ncbi:hypothetical protein ACFSTI_14310 [Rhizorhabdus histidinilytica]
MRGGTALSVELGAEVAEGVNGDPRAACLAPAVEILDRLPPFEQQLARCVDRLGCIIFACPTAPVGVDVVPEISEPHLQLGGGDRPFPAVHQYGSIM